MSRSIDDYFSENYFLARQKFLETCQEHNLPVQSYINPISEDLVTDAVIIGNVTAERVLIVSSGTHGLEGLAGSGIQIGLLQHFAQSMPNNVALCLIHALNPWGMVMGRRQNEDNIDLNRNFIDFKGPRPKNQYYANLHGLICRSDVFVNGQKNPEITEDVERFIHHHGQEAYHAALFQGQYDFPDGIGFGGHKPSWSSNIYRQILNQFSSTARLIALIDLHTGLGDYGRGIMINSSPVGSAAYDLARQWYGAELVSVENIPYSPEGDIFSAAETAFADLLVVPAGLEFGTFPVDQLMQYQIEDRWLHLYGDVASEVGQQIKERLRHFFYPDDSDWRQKIYHQGKGHIQDVIKGLSDYSFEN